MGFAIFDLAPAHFPGAFLSLLPLLLVASTPNIWCPSRAMTLFLTLATAGVSGWVILCLGAWAVLCTVRHLATSLGSALWLLVVLVSPPPVETLKSL